jgi:hypothetical protein
MEIKIRDTAKSNRGWVKPSVGAKYCGVSLKVLRGWMKNHALPFSRLPSGHTRICLDDLDLWLKKRQVTSNLADELLDGF